MGTPTQHAETDYKQCGQVCSKEFSEKSDKLDFIKRIIQFPNANKSYIWVMDTKNLKSGSACVLVLHSLVWWWRIACLTTDFHSFLPGNGLLSINVRKCCHKLYLFKISYGSFRNLEKRSSIIVYEVLKKNLLSFFEIIG